MQPTVNSSYSLRKTSVEEAKLSFADSYQLEFILGLGMREHVSTFPFQSRMGPIQTHAGSVHAALISAMSYVH